MKLYAILYGKVQPVVATAILLNITLNAKVLRTLLNTLHVGRAHHVLGPRSRGVGAILTLHHVRRSLAAAPFSPNRILDITPEFLEQTIKQVRDLGYEIVTLDEVRKRLSEQDFSRKFVCFTLDDGYLDNYTEAMPIFDRLEAPFTVYLATGMPNKTSVLWWEYLEEIVLHHDSIEAVVGNEKFALKSRSTHEKWNAFETVYWALRRADHDVQQDAISRMLSHYDIDPTRACRESAMSWDELKALSENGFATIGAHTVNHLALSKLTDEEVRREASESRRIITERLGVRPQHFCYPYGDQGSAASREFAIIRDLGFATATTTRKGVLFPEHKDHLHALPRISLNGDYQESRYVQLFLSGVPFALMNRFRRLDVS